MRVILFLLLVIGLSAWAGYAVRKKDTIASVILFGFSGLVAAVLLGSFFGWF